MDRLGGVRSKNDKSYTITFFVRARGHFGLGAKYCSITPHMFYRAGKLASVFGFFDKISHEGFHLLFSVKLANVLANQFLGFVVTMHCNPGRICEANSSSQVNNGNPISDLFGNYY